MGRSRQDLTCPKCAKWGTMVLNETYYFCQQCNSTHQVSEVEWYNPTTPPKVTLADGLRTWFGDKNE